MTEITSTQNERVKLARALQTQTRARRREGKIVLEGVRLLADALACGLRPDFVFFMGERAVLDDPLASLYDRASGDGVPCFSVTHPVMKSMTGVETSPGVLAVLPQPQLPVPDAPDLVLVLDGMNNPGNLGSALRTAAAAGVDLVLLPPNTVDPFNPKAMRGGMGAHFRLPIRRASWDDIAAHYGELASYIAVAGGDRSCYDVDWRQPAMLIIGGEAHGPSGQAFAVASTRVSIPMLAGTESLNAAVAAGVILFEARRQRMVSVRGGTAS